MHLAGNAVDIFSGSILISSDERELTSVNESSDRFSITDNKFTSNSTRSRKNTRVVDYPSVMEWVITIIIPIPCPLSLWKTTDKKVTFAKITKVILVPAKEEYHNANCELWVDHEQIIFNKYLMASKIRKLLMNNPELSKSTAARIINQTDE